MLGATACLTRPSSAVGDAPTGATPVLVDQTTNMDSAAASLTLTLPARPAGNYTLILVGGSEKGLVLPMGSQPWQMAVFHFASPSSYMFYAPTDGSAVTVTVMPDAGAPEIWANLSEWSGLATSGPVDDAMGNGAAGGSAISGTAALTITTQEAPELLVFAISHYGSVGDLQTPWIPLDSTTAMPVAQNAWYRIATSAGPQPTQTSYMNEWDAVLAGFRAAP